MTRAALVVVGLGLVMLVGCPPRKAPSAGESAQAGTESATATSEAAGEATSEAAATATATATSEAAGEATCCAQCRAAARQDPQARDLELVECGSYAGRVVNGEAALSEQCAAWFGEHPSLVGGCAP